jgi:hypothetical protein
MTEKKTIKEKAILQIMSKKNCSREKATSIFSLEVLSAYSKITKPLSVAPEENGKIK